MMMFYAILDNGIEINGAFNVGDEVMTQWGIKKVIAIKSVIPTYDAMPYGL
jgi:hypothetical protein